MSIYENTGWFAPATIAVAQGDRSVCNFDEDSLTMAVAAARDCIGGSDKSRIDAVYLCSTTLPYADRLNSGILKTAMNLRDNISSADFSAALKAGTTGLIAALDAVKSGNKKQVLVAASDKRETKPAYFYEMWFGDGAAALLVGDDNVIAEFKGSYSVSHDFVDHYRASDRHYDYMWEERWLREEGYSKFIPEAVKGLFDKLKITMDDVDKVVFPCLFKAEYKSIGKALGASSDKIVDNMHEVCGETGAAHPLLMLVSVLEQAKPGERILVAGFGQGCDALYFVVTENISKLPARQGVKGSLENKKELTNYMKFLKFRNLITPEMGIRAEAPSQTAMTTLWRNRKMITSFMGGICRECGTPQYPMMDYCVKPDCNALHSQDDYEFADKPARVKTFTGDLLAVSVDPPAVYGMVEFEGGGRAMVDFTDCELADVKVGMPVKMTFRIKYIDEQRGFTGYYWKAIPQAGWTEPLPEIRFDGRVAIVTGAGGGLGRTYALELAKRGAKLVINDFGGARDGSGAGSATPAQKVVDEIKALGGEAVANYDNVATVEGGEGIVKSAMDAFGRVDILINNAGILRDKAFLKMEPENWKAVLDVHLNGAYNVTRPAFQVMRENGYGRIIMTTSAAGLYGNFGQTNYSSAKMALVGLMNTMKLEGAKYNIKVNTVAPVAASRLTEDVMPPEFFEKMKPEYVSPIVLYMCSEECAETGSVFNAAAGYYSRAAVLTGRGKIVGSIDKLPTVEDIRDNWSAIDSMEGAKPHSELNVFMGDVIQAFNAPEEESAGSSEKGITTVKGLFEAMPAAFVPEAAKGADVIFQFNISGSEGGDWAVTIKDGTIKVEAGAAGKPTTTIKMADEDFLKLLSGELDGMKAYTSGKLKIGGDMMKSQLIGKIFDFKKAQSAAPAAAAPKQDISTVKGLFQAMPGAFVPEAAKGADVIFQFSISGKGGGDWVVTIKDATIKVDEGKADKPTTTIKMADEDFLKLLSGELDGMKAYTSGKLKIGGDMMKSQLIGKIFNFKK
jgi:3-hydroxy-3-methylglutaryl CoA synthase/NAD(P)-dependent dehydrogenase (short-subunit alcohol dehydrogenase family)/putative sterol carrier protein